MTAILGIDVGLDGALVLMRDGQIIAVRVMPTLRLKRGGKNKREIDPAVLCDWIERHDSGGEIAHAYIEQAGAMPGQGTSSVFAFGRSYGIILGVLAAFAIPVTVVHPARWKKALAVPAAKDGARARASELMPPHAHLWAPQRGELNAVQAAGVAEAGLIAYYGHHTR